MKKPSFLFNRTEFAIWAISVLLIVGSFFIFKPDNYLYLAASLVGATLLIYDAKGHILGQVFTIVFAILYAIISYEVGYYGEMITYVGMTGLVAVFSLISWIMHPSKEDKSVVEINNLGVKQFIYCGVLSLTVTVAFYFILKAFNTNNLILSTVSVFTSFAASYLT
ncbi:MAG: nicotinamide riboside transporter PnuC, partial [Clostridia bacterium]|nr:nicotinamide riboside transporter PnuC [Clostridia bacterium]